jgi:hypothetical protein
MKKNGWPGSWPGCIRIEGSASIKGGNNEEMDQTL